MGNELMTVKECAAFMKCGERSVRRYYQEYDLPYLRVGRQYRFRPDQVEKWMMEAHTKKGMDH